MESHKQALGIIYIVSAVLQFLIMVTLSYFVSMIFSFAMSQADLQDARVIGWVMDIVRYVPPLIVIFVSVPAMIAGIGLLTKKKWAIILALVVGCLKLFSFPIGTAIGVYTIWVYAEENRLAGKQA